MTSTITYLCEGDIKAVGCESEWALTKDHLLTVTREHWKLGRMGVMSKKESSKKQRDKRKKERKND